MCVVLAKDTLGVQYSTVQLDIWKNSVQEFKLEYIGFAVLFPDRFFTLLFRRVLYGKMVRICFYAD